jgi:hypothetical protein
MPNPFDPDPAVSSIFARAASALAASPAAAGVTVTTADLATSLSPWSLAWAEVDWVVAHRLLILRHVEPGWEAGTPWDDAPPAARLATLAQLPELVSRVVAAAARAAQDADLAAIGRIGWDLAGALGTLALQGEGEGPS